MRTKLLILSLAAVAVLSGCRNEGCTDPKANNFDEDAKKDDASCTYDPVGYDIPSTYNFTNVSYSGQTDRLDMLAEMTTLMKTGNTMGTAVDAQVLKDMYANTGGHFTDADLNSSTKQLKSKTFADDQAMFEGWMEDLAAASQSMTAGSQGTAGVVTSNNGDKNYLLDENGVEYTQLIEKGLMGACFYYQIAEVYTREGKIGDAVDNTNVTEGKGTDMEHHWDEAFGYMGVPINFPTNTDDVRFIGKYCNGRDAVLSTNSEAIAAFTKGRAAISNNDYPVRDVAAAEVRTAVEKVFAATAIHYLNGANADFADDALRCHQLSEAYAFLAGLKYNTDKTISQSQLDALLTELGLDYYSISSATITSVRDELASIYGWDNIKSTL